MWKWLFRFRRCSCFSSEAVIVSVEDVVVSAEDVVVSTEDVVVSSEAVVVSAVDVVVSAEDVVEYTSTAKQPKNISVSNVTSGEVWDIVLITGTHSFMIFLCAKKRMRDLPSAVDDATGEVELAGGLGGTSKVCSKIYIYLKWNNFYDSVDF